MARQLMLTFLGLLGENPGFDRGVAKIGGVTPGIPQLRALGPGLIACQERFAER